MADKSITPTLGSGGIYEWSAGAKFTTMLGGAASATIGAKNDLVAGVSNAFTVGVSNSFKATYEVALAFGSSYSYKGAGDVGFSKSSISIQEYGGTRCLDLFQASAGLGTIQRAQFDTQRAAVNSRMRVMVAVDVFAAVSTIAVSGFGTGFANNGASVSNIAEIAGTLTSLSAIIATFSVVTTEYLRQQSKLTKPEVWNPNALLQASSQAGVIIANLPTGADIVYSSFTQNSDGTLLKASRGEPEYLFLPSDGLDDQKHVASVSDVGVPSEETQMSMTPDEVSLAGGTVTLKGLKTLATPLPGSTMSATFEQIGLVSTTESASGPSAQLNLDGTSQTASLLAQTAPGTGSSVQATPEALMLKSGDTSTVVLGAANVDVNSTSVGVTADASLSLSAADLTFSATASVALNGAVIRIG